MNARVGCNHQVWPTYLGHHGIGTMNDNRQRLLEFCTQNDLCITNTYFKVKNSHKVSWKRPRSDYWHQLDHILTRRKHLNTVKLARAYHSVDCDMDHALVIGNIKAKPKKTFKTFNKPKPQLNTKQN